MWVFHLYQIWDLLSLVVKYLIILWFFQPLGRRTEGKRIKAGCFCLLPMAWLYLSPPAALVNLYSLENFSIQMERMLVHWLSIGVFLVLTREISRPAAGYLSGIVTVIFLAVQNFRSAATVFFPLLGSNEANRRFTLCVVIIIEFCILKILRSAIDITKIKSINISSWSTLILSLLLEVYFKWTLLFMQFQAGLMLHREFALFAFCAAFGVMLVLLLTEVNQQVMVEKNRIKTG